MSLETELTAILTAAAIAPITDRAFLRITGPDATRWLNGMVTNNIKDLRPGEGNYNFLLNAQGRIQGDCTIYREPTDGEPTFLLEADSSQLEAVRQILDSFIIMDDVELTSVSMTGITLIGAAAWRTAFELQDREHSYHVPDSSTDAVMRKSPYRNGSQVLLYQPSNKSLKPPVGILEIWSTDHQETLAYAEACRSRSMIPEVSPAALEAYRILSGTPRYGTDIRNTDTARDLPQETAQTHALNFNKGCYLGQEIVERIHSRGQVHRTFARFELTGNLPNLPCALTLDGKPVGELTSAALIPLASGPTLRALGYIRREAATATLAYPNGTAKVLSNP